MITHQSLKNLGFRLYPEIKDNGHYRIIHKNLSQPNDPDGKPEIYIECDGFYVYQPLGSGYFNPILLRAIADQLDSLNQEWQDTLNQDLERLNRSLE